MSEKYFDYDQEKYPFVKLITDFFDCNLQELHLTNEIKYDFFSQPGKDSNTIFHKAFTSIFLCGFNSYICLSKKK